MEPTWREVVADRLGSGVASVHPVRGGDVARAHQVRLLDGRRAFVKTHDSPPPGFFSTEAAGLEWLRAAGAVAIPEVLAVSDAPPLLALEWIDTAAGRHDEAAFGRSLAALHRSGAACFGREDARPTGSRSLPNEPAATWVEFFRDRRLLPLADMAERTQALPEPAVRDLRDVARRLEDLGGPPEPAARLHGDLWSGNRLVDAAGTSWLIDPAAHGGHREFDLAMMRLFGGFGPRAFDAYQEAHPLAPGWRDRIELHQLAPLVVHAIKFGGGYVGAVRQALDRYR